MKKVIVSSLIVGILTGSLFANETEHSCEKELGKGKMAEMSLEEQKSFMLKKMDEHLEKIKKGKECVEKAQTKEELRDCRPEKPKHGEMGEGKREFKEKRDFKEERK